jgi:hypothetical protein
MQDLQPLGIKQHGDLCDASDVAARPIEARDQTKCDRVAAYREDHRYRRGCPFDSERSGIATGCGNHGDLTLDQLARQHRQSVASTIRPAGIRSQRCGPPHSPFH